MVVEGQDDMLIHLARCCSPVPGDPIVGYVTVGRGVSVHRADCTNVSSLAERRERTVEVSWPPQSTSAFVVWIQVEALDRTRLLRDVTSVVSDTGGNITASRLTPATTGWRSSATKWSSPIRANCPSSSPTCAEWTACFLPSGLPPILLPDADRPGSSLACRNQRVHPGRGEGGQAVVVDAPPEPGAIGAILIQHDLTLAAVMLTHGHIDHTGGSGELSRATGASVYVHPDDDFLTLIPGSSYGRCSG